MGTELLAPEAKDSRISSLPRDPDEFLSDDDREELDGALDSIARTRREAEAKSGDLRLG